MRRLEAAAKNWSLWATMRAPRAEEERFVVVLAKVWVIRGVVLNVGAGEERGVGALERDVRGCPGREGSRFCSIVMDYRAKKGTRKGRRMNRNRELVEWGCIGVMRVSGRW